MAVSEYHSASPHLVEPSDTVIVLAMDPKLIPSSVTRESPVPGTLAGTAALITGRSKENHAGGTCRIGPLLKANLRSSGTAYAADTSALRTLSEVQETAPTSSEEERPLMLR